MRSNKNAYRIFLLISFIGVNAAILFGIGAVFSYLNTGADRSTMLRLEQVSNETYVPSFTWENIYSKGRQITDQKLKELTTDYKRSWFVKNTAFRENKMLGIHDYFTDSSAIKIKRIIDLNTKNKVHTQSTTLDHTASMEFMSVDGKLAVFTDAVTSYHQTFKNDSLVFEQRSKDKYRIIALLEDGFWRVRHQIGLPSNTVTSGEIVAHNIAPNLSNIRGVNYYPKKTPWNMFGENFDSLAITRDFKIIKNMGLNMTRVFIPYTSFGKNRVDLVKLQQVATLLDLAQTSNLKVMITLFDFYGDYDIHSWTQTHRHAETIITSLKNHPALLGWDIKNEPDLDFKSRKKYRVKAWLKEMITQIHQWDSLHPVTIGWSSTSAAKNLAQEVDLVSFHYYDKPSELEQQYSELKANVPGNKQLFLQEYGVTSYNGIWKLFQGGATNQAAYYKDIQTFIAAKNIPFAFWTLYDFEEIPTEIVGYLPWRKVPQKRYGIIDENGAKKLSFDALTK